MSSEVWSRIISYWKNFNGNLHTVGFLEFRAKSQGELREGFKFIALNTGMSEIDGVISIYKPDIGEMKFELLNSKNKPYRIYHYKISEIKNSKSCNISLIFEIKTGNIFKMLMLSLTKKKWLVPMINSIGG